MELVKPKIPSLVVLDGDVVRQAFGHDLGHAEDDRIRQFRRLQGMAKILADQDVPVIVAAVYSNPKLLAWSKEHLRGYFEVFLEATLETVRGRDPKGLYKGADSGKIREVVGIDVPFHPPSSPDLVMTSDENAVPQAHALTLIRSVPLFSSVLKLENTEQALDRAGAKP